MRRAVFWTPARRRKLVAYWDHDGWCFRCHGPLAILSMVLVELPHCTAALCGRCGRAGAPSRLRALYAGTRTRKESAV